MSVKDPSDLPGLVFDCYRLKDVVDGKPRAVTLAVALDGHPMIGVSRQSVADKDNVVTGVLVAMVKARPRLCARDTAILRHAFLTNHLPDPVRYIFPMEAVWDSDKPFDCTHRATIMRGILSQYIWLNGRYQVAVAMCDARRMSREKLHDLTMEYAAQLGDALRDASIAKRIIGVLESVASSMAIGSLHIPVVDMEDLLGIPKGEVKRQGCQPGKTALLIGREPRLTPDP
jgi:hypothetical protein